MLLGLQHHEVLQTNNSGIASDGKADYHLCPFARTGYAISARSSSANHTWRPEGNAQILNLSNAQIS